MSRNGKDGCGFLRQTRPPVLWVTRRVRSMIYNIFIHHHLRCCWGLHQLLLRTELSRESRKPCHWVKQTPWQRWLEPLQSLVFWSSYSRVEFTASYSRKFNIKLGSTMKRSLQIRCHNDRQATHTQYWNTGEGEKAPIHPWQICACVFIFTPLLE